MIPYALGKCMSLIIILPSLIQALGYVSMSPLNLEIIFFKLKEYIW